MGTETLLSASVPAQLLLPGSRALLLALEDSCNGEGEERLLLSGGSYFIPRGRAGVQEHRPMPTMCCH